LPASDADCSRRASAGARQPKLHGKPWYVTLDQELYRASHGDTGTAPTVAAFVQMGRSDRHVDAIHEHLGGGIVLSGVVPGARRSVIGLGGTHATWQNGHESIGEVYQQWPLFGGLTLIVDLQRVHHLDVQGGRRVGNVFTMRSVLTF